MNKIYNDTKKIIEFYEQFDEFGHMTFIDLYQRISPSIRNGTCKIFKDSDGMYGFQNWALVSDDVLKRFFKQGRLHTVDWMCGPNLLYVDTVATRDVSKIIRWSKDHSVRMAGVGNKIFWTRSDRYKVKRTTERTTKEHWIWDRYLEQ